MRKRRNDHRTITSILVFLFVGLLPTFLCAKKYHIKQDFINDAFSNREEKIHSICQDDTGYLWYASNKGLVCFDGVTPTTISGTDTLNIIKITKAFKGELLVLTPHILYRFIPNKKEIAPLLSLSQPSTKKLHDITRLGQKIYIASNNGIYHCDSIYRINKKFNKYNVRNLTNGEDRSIYFSTKDNQVYHIDNFDSQIAKFISSVSGEITSLKYRNNSSLWVGTKKDGIIKIDLSSRKQQIFSLTQFTSEPVSIKCFSEDGTGRLWAATSNIGILRIRDRKQEVQITTYRLDRKNVIDPEYNKINTLYRGKSGLLWVGSEGNGLVAIHFYDHAFRTVITLSNSEEVRCILEDKKGYTWVGTLDNGLQRSSFRDIITARKENKEILLKQYTASNSPITSNNITAIEESSDGKIWFSTWGGKLYQLNPITEQITKIEFKELDKFTPISNTIIALFHDSQDRLWVSTSGGVYLLSKNQKQLQKIDLLPLNAKQDTAQYFKIMEADNQIILVSEKGLSICLNNHPFSYEYIPLEGATQNNILSAKLDFPNIWLGTQKGLYKYNTIKQKFSKISDPTNLSETSIKSIEMDKKNNLWLVSKNHILIYNNTLRYFYNLDTSFPRNTLFHGTTFYRPKDRSPKMYIETNNGIIVFRPDFIRLNKDKVKAVVTNLYSKGVYNDSTSTIKRDVRFTNKIKLPNQNNSFELKLTTLGFKNRHNNRIGYQLIGVDKKMNYVMGNHHTLRYHNLKSGKYTLLLTASNCNNIWNKKMNEYTIIIEPPFYVSHIAYLIYILFVIFIILTSIRVLRKKLFIEFGVREQALMMAFAPNDPLYKGKSNYPISGYSHVLDNSTTHNNRYVSLGNLQVSEIDLTQKLSEWCEQYSRYNQIHQCNVHFKSKSRVIAFVDWGRVKTILLDLLFCTLQYSKNQEISIELTRNDKGVFITVKNQNRKPKGLLHFINKNLSRKYNLNKEAIILKTELLVRSHKAQTISLLDENEGRYYTLILPVNKDAYTLEERINSTEISALSLQKTMDEGTLLSQEEIESNAIAQEDRFVEDVIEVIKKNVQDPNFSVSNLADELLVSRSYLHGKLKEISGNSPGELIRTIRLKNAAIMLKTTKHNVQEVAFLNGFNDPKYFSRSFKSAYGLSPKQYKQKYR